MTTLSATTGHLRLLADPNRARLLHLLASEELTVAELVAVTRLAQSRVSTHLGKLRAAGLLRVRRAGTSTYYALNDAGFDGTSRTLWSLLKECGEDPLLSGDAARVRDVLRARAGTWADTVAGRMERHYSPGRTWEAASRALVGLATLGDVLDVASGDGALAELVAPRARTVTCVDVSPRVAEAGRQRLLRVPTLRFVAGDMHALPFPDASFDQVLLVNSLTYSRDPARAVAEAARTLRPGGALVALALKAHRHADTAARFDHVQPGFQPARLRELFERSGFRVSLCAVTSRERQEPHFEVITLYARRGEAPAPHGRRVRRPRAAARRAGVRRPAVPGAGRRGAAR
jgi:ArsR family transcriptional regulator